MRPPVSSWFDKWADEHHQRCRMGKADAPGEEDAEPFWRTIAKLFTSIGVTLEAAEAASERIAIDPPPPRRHIGVLIAHAKEAMRAEGGEPNALPIDDTREAAEAASRGCPHCESNGFAAVQLRATPERRQVTRTVAYCVCRYGRWLRTNHARSSPDVFKRVPDFAEVLAGRSAWEQISPEESIAAL